MPRRLRATLSTALALAAASPAALARAERPIDWEAVSRQATDLLQSYIRIRSINPPADTAEAARFLEGVLRSEGIEARAYEAAPGKVNLMARLRATRAPAGSAPLGAVLLLHHMDVVPVDPSRWRVDPFSGEVRDGYLYGRGSVDMKQVGVIHLLTLAALKRSEVPLKRDVVFLATADEETGGHQGARWMIEHHWDDLAPEYVLDEGGFGARDVLGAAGRLVFGVSVAEKKVLWLKLIATGTAGHGSQPTADNPNVLLARALSAIASRTGVGAVPPVVGELRARIGDLAVNKFTNAIQRDTVSITALRAGVGEPPKANVIPSSAEATLDCRLLPGTDPDAFLRDIEQALPDRQRMKLEVIYRMDETPVTPHQTALFAALEKAIRAEHPDAVVAPMLIPYGTDSNSFRVRGAKAYGLTPMVLDASIIASMHSDEERVPVAELVRGVRILYNGLKDFCGG